ncbi:dna mismatch repair c-terminal domain-containing protein, partial [Cystoisospora suis]
MEGERFSGSGAGVDEEEEKEKEERREACYHVSREKDTSQGVRTPEPSGVRTPQPEEDTPKDSSKPDKSNPSLSSQLENPLSHKTHPVSSYLRVGNPSSSSTSSFSASSFSTSSSCAPSFSSFACPPSSSSLSTSKGEKSTKEGEEGEKKQIRNVCKETQEGLSREGERRIRMMSEEVAESICSQQVIVGLKAVCKELVENSIDAGATAI